MDDVRAQKVNVFTDEDEFAQWKQRGDPVLHIEVEHTHTHNTPSRFVPHLSFPICGLYSPNRVSFLSFLPCKLRRRADAFLIAPLSANTLAKLANGLCDNLLVLYVTLEPSQRIEKRRDKIGDMG